MHNTINTVKHNFKTFDEFISYYFDRLSAHTLFQSLCDLFSDSFLDSISNAVYVVLYEIYTGYNVTEAHINTFNTLRSMIVDIDNELNEEYIQRTISEEAFCLEFGYVAVNLEWLKNNALDWYINHVISLETFKRIAAL